MNTLPKEIKVAVSAFLSHPVDSICVPAVPYPRPRGSRFSPIKQILKSIQCSVGGQLLANEQEVFAGLQEDGTDFRSGD
jgi:hypothetical protein